MGVNLEALVDEVHLGPALSEDEIQAARNSMEARGLGKLVRISSLLGHPRYV
ncbi:hypothetical protein D3C86_2032880 [compost metagenome]